MSSKIKKNILKLKESSTLVINEKSKDLIKQGKKVYQFGFGQSPFPVPEKIVEALKNHAHRKEYLPIQPGDVPQTWADISLIEKLGYKSKVGLKEGVDNFVKWFEYYH